MKKIAAIIIASLALTGCQKADPDLELNQRLCFNTSIAAATQEAKRFDIDIASNEALHDKVYEISAERCALDIARANATDQQRLVMNPNMRLVEAGNMFQKGFSYEEASVIRAASNAAQYVGFGLGAMEPQDARIFAAEYHHELTK